MILELQIISNIGKDNLKLLQFFLWFMIFFVKLQYKQSSDRVKITPKNPFQRSALLIVIEPVNTSVFCLCHFFVIFVSHTEQELIS